MTENPEQPEQTEEQSNEQDLDLEAQLDALLRELEVVDPESVPPDLRKVAEEPAPAPAPATPEPVQATPVEPEPAPITAEEVVPTDTPPTQELDLETISSMAANMLDQQIESTIEAASGVTESGDPESAAISEPEPVGGLSEDELGDQIDAMLSNVQAQIAQPEPAPEPEPAPVAEAEPTPEPIPEPAPIEPQPDAAVPVEAAAEDTDEVAEEPAEAGAVSIQQIDAMLADSAEQAIESEPEASEHVPGTDEILAAQAQEEAAEAQASAEPQPVPQPAEPEPTPVQSFDAGADDVARELDEDPQPEAVAAEPAPVPEPSAVFESAVEEVPQAPAADTHPDEEPESTAVVNDEKALKKAERALLRICGKINSPLYRLSPEMRETVGWVGVVTLGLGLFMFLFGIIF